jgi:hypothetical protein
MSKAILQTPSWAQSRKNQKRKTNKYMKKKLILIIWAVMCLALAPAAVAQVVNGDEPNNSMLYLPNVNLATLTQNSFVGTVGGIFYTPYYYNVSINWLGFADPTGAALVDNHQVTIWNHSTGSIVASAVVPAGDPLIYDGYAWVKLPSTVTLTYQHYYDIGAQVFNDADIWGNLINNTATDPGNNGQITWNVENGSWSGTANGPMVQAGGGYEFSRAGVYDSAGNYPNMPPNQTSTTDSIYPAPNMAYNLPIPEPASLSIAGIGAALLFGLGLKRKAKAH